MPLMLPCILSSLLIGGTQTPPASFSAPSAPLVSRIQGSTNLFRVQARHREVMPIFKQLGFEAGVKIKAVSVISSRATLDLPSATLEEAIEAICRSAGIAARKLDTGAWVVGHDSDLTLFAAGPQDTADVDVAYRCEYLSADSMSGALSKAFPGLRIVTGPLFLSPQVEGNNPTTVDDAKALTATDQAFKTHDVLISGPANLVKRATLLAMKFDRPRKQVRINIKLTELSGTLDSDLGINWSWSAMALQEVADKDLTPPNSAKGIKIGSFTHTAAAISATLQAREHAGKAKTLANPSLTLLDGERSFILIGERRLYPKQTGVNTQGLPIFDIAEIRTGIYLQVAVQVGLENDLTLSVFPQVSSLTEMVPMNNSSYPIIATREAQTTVRLRSGEMLAIGGLKQLEDSTNTTGIPFLSRIPLFGRLFGVKNKIKNSTELLLIVVPEILTEESQQAPGAPTRQD